MRGAVIPLPVNVLVVLLGVTQIVSWGTLFYSIAVLGAPMREALGASDITLFAAFSAGLLASGFVAPVIGRDIDAHGGRRVLVWGSVLAAASMALLAAAQSTTMLAAGWLLAGIASAATLYDAGFATLHQFAGASFRRAVTLLTLLGGFASTVFWPLSRYLLESVGWREAFAIYAALHLVVCLPVHAMCVPRVVPVPTSTEAPQPSPRAMPAAFLWMAFAMSVVSFASAAISAHLMTLLSVTGLAARDAVLIGSLIGPMQVAGRIVEYGAARNVAATSTGTFAFALMAVALCVLSQVHGVWIVALAFVITYGWANGVFTIVRGTVPRVLFGAEGYGALLGRLARPQFFARAIAPVTLSLVQAIDGSRRVAPYLLTALGVVALFAYRRALRLASEPAPGGVQHVADNRADD
jgi:MFS family permease